MILWVGSLILNQHPVGLVSLGHMELEIMAFVVSVPIPILIPMSRFQCRGLQMATIKLLTIQSKFINTLAKD